MPAPDGVLTLSGWPPLAGLRTEVGPRGGTTPTSRWDPASSGLGSEDRVFTLNANIKTTIRPLGAIATSTLLITAISWP